MIRPPGQGIRHCQNCFVSGDWTSGARYEPAYHLSGRQSASPEHRRAPRLTSPPSVANSPLVLSLFLGGMKEGGGGGGGQNSTSARRMETRVGGSEVGVVGGGGGGE